MSDAGRKFITTPEELGGYRQQILDGRDPDRRVVAVCSGPGCLAYSGTKLYDSFVEQIKERGLDENGRIPQLYMGAYPVDNPGQGRVYPGDRALHDDNVCVQIHRVSLTIGAHEAAIDDVPIVAVWVPERFGQSWVAQVQT